MRRAHAADDGFAMHPTSPLLELAPPPPPALPVVKTAETVSTSFALRADGTVLAVARPIPDHGLTHAQDNLEALAALLEGGRAPLVLDVRRTDRAFSPEARALYVGPEAARYVRAIAFVAGGALTRMIANVVLSMGRVVGSPIPLAVFDREDEALLWARTHLPD